LLLGSKSAVAAAERAAPGIGPEAVVEVVDPGVVYEVAVIVVGA